MAPPRSHDPAFNNLLQSRPLPANPPRSSSFDAWDDRDSGEFINTEKALPPTPQKPLPQVPENQRFRNGRRSSSSSMSSRQDLEMNTVQNTGYARVDDHEARLLEADKPNHRKRRSTITRDGVTIDVDNFDPAQLGKILANKAFLHNVLINTCLIALWYIFSISISIYNKWMFSKVSPGQNLGGKVVFPFPLFTTSFHMLVQFCMASLTLYFFPKFRPQNQTDPDMEIDRTDGSPQRHGSEEKKPLVTPMFYITRIAPCGAATGLDIGLGNTSLKFITLTFFTMCKSSTLGFVLLFAVIFGLEKPSWRLGAIILVMTIGVIMMVAGETHFDAIGFILLMLASFFSGLRWSLTQILLRRNPATSNPFASLFYLTPIMFLVLIVIALPSEGPNNIKMGFDILVANKGLIPGTAILVFPGILAFLMVSAEFALLQRTSVVTLSVCGIFKEVITITAASYIFKDNLTPINISGLVVTISAIAAYNYVRIRSMRRRAEKKMVAQIERLDPDERDRSPLFATAAATASASAASPHDPASLSPDGTLHDADVEALASTNVAAPLLRRSSLNGHARMVSFADGGPKPGPVKRFEDLE